MSIWRSAVALFAMLLPLCMPLTSAAQEKVIFEDKFEGPCSPKWRFVEGDWAVVDGAFQVVRGYWGTALLDLPLPDEFAIEVTFGELKDVLRVLFAYDSAERYWAFRVASSSTGWSGRWIRVARGSDQTVGEKSFYTSGKTTVRIEVRKNLLLANIGTTGWEWATTVPKGKIGITMDYHARIYSFRVLSLGATDSQQQASGAPSPQQEPKPAIAAPFAVDPRDLDRLAKQLAQECGRNERARRQMQEGAVAIATFDLVDIPSPSVARNVVEDLYTSMTQAGFQLIERGQLDKVMKELRLRATDAIDSAQAQRLGNLTGASLILVGSISDRGNFVVVNARLLETSTGSAVAATRVEMRKVKIER